MINPYKKPRPRPQLAWLLNQREALTESHDQVPIGKTDHQIWSDFETISELLTQGHGQALCWDNRPIRWTPNRDRIISWPVRVMQIPAPEPGTALKGLSEWRDWLCSYGAAPAGSLGGSGLSLLKARLEEPLWTRAGNPPPIEFVIGGRQETGPRADPPCIWEGPIYHWDMQAAYAKTLGHLNYGGWWRRANSNYPFDLDAKNGVMVFVRARVRVPDLPFGPLPRRPRKFRDAILSQLLPLQFPTNAIVQGVWTWDEIQAAREVGCGIKILEGWYHEARIDQRPFFRWWEAIEEGRKMDGFAGVLAKATGNSTWGQFAIRPDGQRAILRISRLTGRPRRIVRPLPGGGNPSQRAPDLGEYICGRIRAQLFRAMMIAGDKLICAHTDGLWLHGDTTIPDWRRKREAIRLRLIGPQDLAYRPPGAAKDEYLLSGIHSSQAEDFFEEHWRELEIKAQGRRRALRPRDRLPKPIPIVT